MRFLLGFLLLTLCMVNLGHADTWGAFNWGTGKWSPAVSINGSCGSANGTGMTAAPSTNLCSAGIASTVDGTGPWSWNCAGINGGIAAPCSAYMPAFELTAALAGTGSGSINGGISCVSGGLCSTATYPPGTIVTLIATASPLSTFDGWSGVCSNITGNCSFSMDSHKTITAIFNAAPKAHVSSKTFESLQAAYDDPSTGTSAGTSIIKLLEGEQKGAFTATGKLVTLNGGYNAAYTAVSTETTIEGGVTIRSGTIRVNRLKVR